MLHVQKFTFNAYQENTYLVYNDDNLGVIIDPGCYETHEHLELTDFVEAKGIKIVNLLNTHCHVDHVLGNSFVKEKFGVDLWIHKEDHQTLKSVEVYAHVMGFNSYQPAEHDHFFDLTKKVEIGNDEMEILFVPGHAPGHVVFVDHTSKFVINGDVLFSGSIGRTDLPGGDFSTLEKSIQEVMYQLPDDYLVYCGHGPETTIGQEKGSNPYVRPIA